MAIPTRLRQCGRAITESTEPTEQCSHVGVALHYRPDIDGLRAVAIISVLLFHASPRCLPGGFVGVDIFFVISGFLISGIILKDLERGKFSFADFYARRIGRIFPSLLLVTRCCSIVSRA